MAKEREKKKKEERHSRVRVGESLTLIQKVVPAWESLLDRWTIKGKPDGERPREERKAKRRMCRDTGDGVRVRGIPSPNGHPSTRLRTQTHSHSERESDRRADRWRAEAFLRLWEEEENTIACFFFLFFCMGSPFS